MNANEHPAWAVISPAGELAWYPLSATREVEALAGGKIAPGALDTATVAGRAALRGRVLYDIPPGCGPLKVLASDIGALFPADYPPNPLAARMLTALSGGRITQQWHGAVALVEYEHDEVSGEVLWPGAMSEHWQQMIREAAGSAVKPAAGPSGGTLNQEGS